MNDSYHTYEWVMSHIFLGHLAHMNESRHTYEWVTSHIFLGVAWVVGCVWGGVSCKAHPRNTSQWLAMLFHVTHLSGYIYICYYSHMGWLRLVGSSKLQVSFAEYSLFCRALLQKRPTMWRSLLIEDTLHPDCMLLFTHPDMGWLRLVGSIKLQVSFAKEPYKRDAILQKRPIT